MYLSEKKRAATRKCIENQPANFRKNKKSHIRIFYDSENSRKVSRILFDKWDGKEIFIPF